MTVISDKDAFRAIIKKSPTLVLDIVFHQKALNIAIIKTGNIAAGEVDGDFMKALKEISEARNSLF